MEYMEELNKKQNVLNKLIQQISETDLKAQLVIELQKSGPPSAGRDGCYIWMYSRPGWWRSRYYSCGSHGEEKQNGKPIVP